VGASLVRSFQKATPRIVPARPIGTNRLTAAERKIADTFASAVRDLTANIETPALSRALSSGSVSNAVQAFDWGAFGSRMSDTRSVMLQQIAQTGKAEAKNLASTVGRFTFNVTDPRAASWAASRSGELVVQVSDSIRSEIRSLITNSFVNQIDPREIARQLSQTVGLHDRWAGAVTKTFDRNFADFLAQGYSPSDALDAANRVAERYRDRLLVSRGSMIARTEVMTAANQGRAISWQQAGDAGLFNPLTSSKEWIAEGDACPDCEAVDGETVGLDDDFSVGEYMPPAHPSCRCTAVLIPGE
jgi:SPP1 gp7 family putative phage head morphogenesis protein